MARNIAKKRKLIILLNAILLFWLSIPVAHAYDESNNLETDKLDTQILDDKAIARFTNTVGIINQFYVKHVDKKILLENALRGIVSGLDSRSEYLDEKAYKNALLEGSQVLAGIGIEATTEFEVLKVISPIDNSPAAKAGLESGDYIVEINHKLVSNMSLEEALKTLQGKKDSIVNLTVLRPGSPKPLAFNIVRDDEKSTYISSKMIDTHMLYLRIGQFEKDTPSLVADLIKKSLVENKAIKGMIIDLRNVPGGDIERIEIGFY